MNKKGFTLVELLVVIVIIGILSVIIIPSVININSGINERLYEQKKENIEAAAILYGNNNEEIFNGTDQVPVYVYELVESNYFQADIEDGKGICSENGNKGLVIEGGGSYITNKGCVVNPMDKSTTLNSHYVILTKEASGISAKYVDPTEGNSGNGGSGDSKTLVAAVCDGFKKGTFSGQAYSGGNKVPCYCNESNTGFASDSAGKNSLNVSACIISGDNVNNYLRYGDSKANWRVLGVYKVNGSLSAKMITSEPI